MRGTGVKKGGGIRGVWKEVVEEREGKGIDKKEDS